MNVHTYVHVCTYVHVSFIGQCNFLHSIRKSVVHNHICRNLISQVPQVRSLDTFLFSPIPTSFLVTCFFSFFFFFSAVWGQWSLGTLRGKFKQAWVSLDGDEAKTMCQHLVLDQGGVVVHKHLLHRHRGNLAKQERHVLMN